MADLGYARVSTVQQDEAIQLLDLERAGVHPSNIFSEKVSGVAKDRPVRDQVLARLRPGDALVVWKLDRLGRDMTEIVGIVKGLVQRGVRFRCITQNINIVAPLDPMSAMQLQLLAMFAEFEKALLLERTAAGKARRRAEGKHPGAVPMFGWKPGNMEPDPVEAQALERVAGWLRDDGLNLSQAVERMNALDDFPPPRKAQQWRVVSLRRILVHPRTREIMPGHYDALQTILNRNRGQGRGAGGGRPAEHLLSGILICGRCGQPMYLIWSTRKGVRQAHYHCKPMAGSGGRFRGCSRTSIVQGRADEHARELFILSVVGEPFQQALNQRQAELLAGEVTAEELDAWRAEILDLETIAPTRFYGEQEQRRHDELRRLVDQATARLMAAPDLQEMTSLPRSEDELRAAWSRWSVQDRRRWLRRLLERIEVMPAEGTGRGSNVEERMVPIYRL
jgi:DNA invertase Pin-like site-specific DNA recombinase